MKCEICKKETASFYRYVAALGKQVPVCSCCLQKISAPQKSGFSGSVISFEGLADILANFQPATESYSENENANSRTVMCPNCGFEFEEYFETGRLGCVKCYDVFHEKIRNIVYKIHGSVRHNGSRPNNSNSARQNGSRLS